MDASEGADLHETVLAGGLAERAKGVIEGNHPGVAIRDTSASSSSTIPADTPESTTELALHVAAFAFVGAVLLLAATSFLGVRTGTVAAQGEGYSIEVLRRRSVAPVSPLRSEWSSRRSTGRTYRKRSL